MEYFGRAKTAKEQYSNAQIDEETKVQQADMEIGSHIDGNRGAVTLSEEEYQEFKRKGKTLLWTGTADKIGSKDSSNNPYTFIDSSMDIDNYDFILIECFETKSSCASKQAVMLSPGFIKKNSNNDIRLLGYDIRSTDMHFVDNGFVVDAMRCDGSTGYYLYVKNIWGLNV